MRPSRRPVVARDPLRAASQRWHLTARQTAGPELDRPRAHQRPDRGDAGDHGRNRRVPRQVNLRQSRRRESRDAHREDAGGLARSAGTFNDDPSRTPFAAMRVDRARIRRYVAPPHEPCAAGVHLFRDHRHDSSFRRGSGSARTFPTSTGGTWPTSTRPRRRGPRPRTRSRSACRSWRSTRGASKSPKDLLAVLTTMFELDLELSRLSVYAQRPVRRGRPGGAAARDETGGRGAGDRVRGGDLLGASRDPGPRPRQGAPLDHPGERSSPPIACTWRRRCAASRTRWAPPRRRLSPRRARWRAPAARCTACSPTPTCRIRPSSCRRASRCAWTRPRTRCTGRRATRADRDKVFASFFGALKTYERTMGATLAAAVKAHLFEKRVRQLRLRAGGGAVPGQHPDRPSTSSCSPTCTAACRRCIATWRCARRCSAWTSCATRTCTCRWSRASTCASSPTRRGRSRWTRWRRSGRRTPMRCSKGFDSRWTDYLPSTGKRSGAYSTGVYGVHPYQLLNFNGRYEDLTTLAHESGHSMHTFLSHAGAALSDRRLFDLRRRGGVDVQREPADSHDARPREGRRHAAVPAGHAARRPAHDAVPADPVRRVRAALSTSRPSAASR